MQRIGGKVQYAPLRIRVCEGKFREPDLLLVRDANDPRRQDRFWLGADMVVEIVSPDDPECDTKVKGLDYAEADIPEYWIFNPEDETITVLTLAVALRSGQAPLVDAAYMEHGLFRRGETASSALLEDFTVKVADVFDAN